MLWLASAFRAALSAAVSADCALATASASAVRSGCPLSVASRPELDVGELSLQSCCALLVIALGTFKLIAAGGQISERAGQVGKGLFRRRQRFIRGSNAAVHAGKPLGTCLCFGLQMFLFGIQTAKRGCRVGGECAFAIEVGGELFQAAIEFANPLLGTDFFTFQSIAGKKQALQRRRCSGFGFAQRRQSGRDLSLPRCRNNLLTGACGDDPNGFILGSLGIGDFGLSAGPAQMQQQRLGSAHLSGNVAVAHRLSRLGLERGHLRGELPDHVLGARQVLLGGPQPQLRLVTARVQSGNAGGLFKDAPPLVGARLDDFADAALMDQGRRARAGRGIGKQHSHVARTNLAAVDAKHRAVFAHDAP